MIDIPMVEVCLVCFFWFQPTQRVECCVEPLCIPLSVSRIAAIAAYGLLELEDRRLFDGTVEEQMKWNGMKCFSIDRTPPQRTDV